MEKKSTFIKIDRNIQSWRWYTNANTFRVFFHLLLNANVYERAFENVMIKRGEVVISYPRLSNSLKLTIQEVRTAIEHLKLTGEITVTKYSKFQVISIVNYGYYQSVPTGKATANQQSTNSQSTVNQQSGQHQYKNIKNIKKEKKEKNMPAGGSALSGDEEILVHPNSGVEYVIRDGEMFDLRGRRLNSHGYEIIDFGIQG